MVFIPLSDEAPHARRDAPYVTYAIIALNILVFLWRQAAGGADDIVFQRHWGVTPSIVVGDDDIWRRFAPFVTYMFLHGGWAHLFGNMLFLWIFGDDIEDAVGHARFVVFYLVCGFAGALIYCLFSTLPDAPLVGASGAVAGMMGAYLMIRPCANVHVLVFIRVVAIRAMWVILAWAALQIWHVLAQPGGDVAWWAHVGGLATGAALIVLFRQPGVRLFECMQQGGIPAPKQAPWGGPRMTP